ncbi:hypothetical protein [Microbulbifer sp. S227A]|uniref:hypothetical protein n=1 Tax=Microbulbifer sp. S227A TaxID=3415131 RepID=UPI003C7AE08D
MKTVLKAAAVAVAAMAAPLSVAAEAWMPEGPIKMLIAFRAGGGADTQARLIAEELEARHGWSVIPEQVPGKGGLNAVKAIIGEPGDGTAIAMIVTGSLGYNMAAARAGKPTDVTPIVTTAGTQMAVVALASKGWKTFDDVLDAARSGTPIRFGVMTPRLGDMVYVLEKRNDVDFNIVSLTGGKAVIDGLNAGDLDVGFGAGIQAKAVASGDMVELASALDEPLVSTPDAPLLRDFNLGFVSDTTFMFAGPKDMDPRARDAIANAIAEIVQDAASKPHVFINKAFGGPKVVMGDALATGIQQGYDDAGALMNAVNE